MNHNTAPIELLWTAIGLAGLAVTMLCYRYARLDRARLGRSESNGLLDRIAREALERELSRFLLFLMLTLAGILAVVPTPNATVSAGMLVGANALLVFNAVRTLAFRRWLLQQKAERS